MTLLSDESSSFRSEPAELLVWVRRRFVRWLQGVALEKSRWQYAAQGEALVPVGVHGAVAQKLALHDDRGESLDVQYRFAVAGMPVGAASFASDLRGFAPEKTGRFLWTPGKGESDGESGSLRSLAGMKRAFLIDLHALFGRLSLGGAGCGAMMLLGVDPVCAAWIRKIGFHSQRLRDLAADGRGGEAGFSFEAMRDDVDMEHQETGFLAALFFDGVTESSPTAVAYGGEIVNATAEHQTADPTGAQS